MAQFIEKYVRTPVADISRFEQQVSAGTAKGRMQLLDLIASATPSEIKITLGGYHRIITRREDPSLADDESNADT